ncbi:POC1 centriolar protein A [Tulasnella sp. 427]|nr:POC1 centriolar protein A [Tulasnella sp. 427]
MDELYSEILQRAFNKAKKNPRIGAPFLRVIGMLVVAPYPTSLETIAFFCVEQDVFKDQTLDGIVQRLRLEVLVDLGSLIHIPPTSTDRLHLMHSSIRDLLVDKERAGPTGEAYWVNVISHHGRLATDSLRFMIRDLRANICNLSDLSKGNSETEVRKLVQQHVPQGLQYCCRAWSVHLTESIATGEPGEEVIRNEFGVLSKTKLLGWLEVMSLLGEARGALEMAKTMCAWLQVSPTCKSKYSSIDIDVYSDKSNSMSEPLLFSLWDDMRRFIKAYYEPLAFGALHIYASALPFCPTETELWTRYRNLATAHVLNGFQSRTWPPNVWRTQVDTEIVAISFSPDGALVVYGARNGSIGLLDAETGAPIGHNSLVLCITYSPNGTHLASGSEDHTIRLWDAETGALVQEPLQGHEGAVWKVAFAPSGNLLASASGDSTIRLWDVQTRAPFGEPLRDHEGAVWSVSFSQNGKLLASSSADCSVRLWDPATGAAIGVLYRGRDYGIWSVSISPDSKLIAYGSGDSTVQMWSAESNVPIGERFAGHDGVIWGVAFSPKGRLLASGSVDRTVRLWNAESAAPPGEPLMPHEGVVESVSFSPDKRLVASGSRDCAIQLWNTETGKPIGEPLRGHKDAVRTVLFCPDAGGKLLASGSVDRTIRVWDVETGTLIREPLVGHDGVICSLRFSGSKLLASASYDRTIRLWNIETMAPIEEPLVGHDGIVWRLRFSPDGKLLASGSSDRTIRVWDVETWTLIGNPIKGYRYELTTLLFSKDSRHLVAKSTHETLRWDVQTLMPISEPVDSIDDSTINETFVLSNEGQWVTCNSKRLLWLPAQYWAHASGRKIMISHRKLVFSFRKLVLISNLSASLKV